MAGESYYYLFSVGLFFAAMFHIVNMITFRLRNRDLIGNKYTAGTIEFVNMSRFSGRIYFSAAILMAVLLLANLINAIRLVLEAVDRNGAVVVLAIVPVMVIIIILSVLFRVKSKFKSKDG